MPAILTRPPEVNDLHSTVFGNVAKARKLNIIVLGSGSSIGHAEQVSIQERCLLIAIHDHTPASVQEAFAVAIRCLTEDNGVVVIRHDINDHSYIPEGMALYGTGGEYNHGKDRYDPQATDLIEEVHPDGTPFTPCGLAWRHHGTRALLNLGCPKDIIRDAHEDLMRGIIRDIDHEAARQTPDNIWTVAKAVRDIDDKDNAFDASVAAFLKMTTIARDIMARIIAESILRITEEEVQIGKADMDFIWQNAWLGNEVISGDTLTQRPDLCWEDLGLGYLQANRVPDEKVPTIFSRFQEEIIPSLCDADNKGFGMTVGELAQKFGLRYAVEFYDIARILLDSAVQHMLRN